MSTLESLAHALSCEGMAEAVDEADEATGLKVRPTSPTPAPRANPTGLEARPPDDDHVPAWNPWLFATASRMRAVVADVAAQLLIAESRRPELARKRPRRADDLTVFEGAVDSLLSHASREHIRGGGPVRLSLDKRVLGKRGRYVSPLYSKQLPRILELLSLPEMAFLKVTKGVRARPSTNPFTGEREVIQQTRFEAGPRLVSRLEGVTVADFDVRPGQEVVLLKGTKDDRTGIADLVEYDDTDDTHACRAEVRKINAHLKGASIEYGGTTKVDETERALVRRFTRSSWGCGGRLWGGFWHRLKKSDRLANVRIDGQRVVSIDLNAAVLRFAYAYVGASPPDGDLYSSISFTDTAGSPRVLPRDVVKKIVASRLNGAKEWPEEMREHRAGLPWARVVASLKAAHPALAELFDRDCGQELTFTESEVLVDTLLRLQEQGITALPVHDCIVVAEGCEADAVTTYLDSFKFHTKQTGVVAVDRAKE